MSSWVSCTGLSPSLAGFPKTVPLPLTNHFCSPNPSMHARWFGLFPVRSPLLRKSSFLSPPLATLDVSVHQVPSIRYGLAYGFMKSLHVGFPIQKSPDHGIFAPLPKLIAAYHVFHRLSVPRHPPCALCCLALSDTIALISDGFCCLVCFS